jgi:hypothetical protein
MKRFTDTELFDKEWYMNLSCRLKCVVRYLFDKCDNAGVWTPNYTLAAVYVGEAFTEDEILKIDGGEQFEKFGEKIFVKGFIDFQYGELSENCNPHKQIIKKLIKYGLWENQKLRVPERVPDTLKEKDQDKEKEMDKDKDFGKFENLLIPEMLKTFKKFNKSYPQDVSKDYQPLQLIAKFICQNQSIPYNPREQPVKDEVLNIWSSISEFISKDKFFKTYNLILVEKHIQSISQKISHGTESNSKVNGEQINEAFAKYYSYEQPTRTG